MRNMKAFGNKVKNRGRARTTMLLGIFTQEIGRREKSQDLGCLNISMDLSMKENE